MSSLVSTRRLVLAVGVALSLSFLAFLIASSSGTQAVATHKPADKVIASGSTTEVMGPNDPTGETILSGVLRTSTPSDLILSVTAECSIVTDVKTVGNDDQKAEGKVEVWVEIDGKRVGVENVSLSTTSSKAEDDGEVVFCNRAYQRKTTLFDDEDATIETFETTKAANGFNWVALNVGNGVHTVEVKARLSEVATPPEPEDPPGTGTQPPKARAEAVVGNRTLVVEPAKLANDANVTNGG